MNKLDPDVLAAVLEAYDPEGVTIWLTNWFHADPARLARMEAGVKAAWSGQWPDTLGPQADEPRDGRAAQPVPDEGGNGS